MANNKFNFTKVQLEALPIPDKNKRAYYYDTKTRGLGISITSTGTKTFIVYRWLNGKPERITLGRYPDLTIEQARNKVTEINATIAKGDNPNDKRRAQRAEITLGDLERHAKAHKKSWQGDSDQFKRYLTPWAQRKLSLISKADIQKLHHHIGRDIPLTVC